MKESLTHIDNRIIFRETFNDEFSVRRNNSVVSTVDSSSFINGRCYLDGKTTNIDIKKVIKAGTSLTFRFICKISDVTPSSTNYFIDFRKDGTGNTHYLYFNPSGTIANNGFTSVSVYINSIQTSSLLSSHENQWIEVVISAINTYNISIGSLGRYNLGTTNSGIDFELLEIYKGTLTAEEIKNLYNKRTYVELPDIIDENTYKILDVHSLNGVLIDKMGNTLTPTDVSIKKIGNVYSPSFNGSTSKIDAGNFDPLTDDITILAWIKESDPSSTRYILDNTKLKIFIAATRLYVRSDGITNALTATGIIIANKYHFIAIKRTSTGLVTIDVDLSNKLSSTTSGTPVAGTNIIEGFAINGKIPRLTIYTGILSAEQIAQYYSSTKQLFK